MSVEIPGKLVFEDKRVWFCGEFIRCELYRPGDTAEAVADVLRNILDGYAHNMGWFCTEARRIAT